jgi:hypothetical protein
MWFYVTMYNYVIKYFLRDTAFNYNTYLYIFTGQQ